MMTYSEAATKLQDLEDQIWGFNTEVLAGYKRFDDTRSWWKSSTSGLAAQVRDWNRLKHQLVGFASR
jgi:hypothetical protein